MGAEAGNCFNVTFSLVFAVGRYNDDNKVHYNLRMQKYVCVCVPSAGSEQIGPCYEAITSFM